MRHPKLDLSCNTQVVKVYVHSEFHRIPERYSISSSDPLPLSPTTRWESPSWVADFVRKHRQHLLLSRRCSAQAVATEASPLTTSDPRITLAPGWYHLPNASSPMPTEEWQVGPLLVRAPAGVVEALRINPTLEAVVSLLGDGCRVSSLRQKFPRPLCGL